MKYENTSEVFKRVPSSSEIIDAIIFLLGFVFLLVIWKENERVYKMELMSSFDCFFFLFSSFF